MQTLPYLETELDFPRRFVGSDIDLGSWDAIEPYYQHLADRTFDDLAGFEAWLADWSEFVAAIDEEGARRYVLNSMHTDDEALEKDYLDFVENIQPKCEVFDHRLKLRFVESPFREQLPQPRYLILERGIRTSVSLFREENVALETEDTKLGQQYGKLCGAMMVEFDGQEQTLQQMSRYFEETDRGRREEAWRLVSDRRLQDAERFEELYDEMIKLRHQVAQNAGFADYRGYIFPKKQRFDYSPADCEQFHQSVETLFVPLAREATDRRAKALGVDSLRPWDQRVDVKGRDPLRPFKTSDELCDGCSKIFHKIDPELGAQFEMMRVNGMLDLDSRKGKRPGGYQATFEEHRHPFIFMNAVGLQRDLETLLHEGGHAFHCLAFRDRPLLHDRGAPMEFCEVASMAMELLALEFLDVFYTPEEIARVKRRQMEDIVGIFPWIATIDAFQHWAYANPGHTRQQREEHWLKLDRRFGSGVSWDGLEGAQRYRWHAQLHLFEVPFYYVEYGIAQLGALQVWRNARENLPDAVAAYRRALQLGNTVPLPDLYAAADIKFDFSEDTIRPLIELIQAELEVLPD